MPRISRTTYIIILLGIVSLFADFTYEGGRSIIPQFFTTTLGGSVSLLGIVVGLADFIGYGFRIVSGRLVDKTRKYWALIFSGYAINLASLPLLAITGNYWIAAVLIFSERFGKAVRSPPKDFVVSTLAKSGRVGRAFMINQALDQTGAVMGAIAMSVVLLLGYGYRSGFAILAVPALLSMAFLFVSYRRYMAARLPRRKVSAAAGLTKGQFLLYSAGVGISAAGLYNVAFMLYGSQAVASRFVIPLIFLVAMIGEGAFGALFGFLYDRMGKNLAYFGLLFAIAIPMAIAVPSLTAFVIGALLFGAAMGIHDTVMRSVVGDLVKKENRGYAFGVFNAFYGSGLFIASAVVGIMYSSSAFVTYYVAAMQAVAAIIMFVSFRRQAIQIR
ncbi:MAG: MFS transporter [Candidatus Marsarchaeota archaeon]|nr:MFS transporter [Candidatus Marsarchaeota archaeon]MCL5413530.1 MFS transporter [Candidatus Marsarchaeota archaeon]